MRLWDKEDNFSLTIPGRREDGGWVRPRIILDWKHPYAPRRLYWAGRRVSWIMALGRDGKIAERRNGQWRDAWFSVRRRRREW